MELPRNKNGEVDYNTLGNMLVAYGLGEVHCASYVDRLYGKEAPGFVADTDWRFFYKEKDVVVLQKHMEDSPIRCYMGRSVVDLPAAVVHGFLADNEAALHFDRFCVESRLVKVLRDEVDKKDAISYMRHESKHCLVRAKRDFVFYVRWEAMNDGKCVMSCLSIDHSDCPKVYGITRGQLKQGSGWVLEPYQGDPNRTLVSYIVHVNLVNLPPLITNRVMRRVPLSIYHLKEYLQHNRPPTLSQLHILPSHQTPDRHSEVPTSPQIPTPTAAKADIHSNLSSLPMESNPLYQSTNLYMSGARIRTQSQESWRYRGAENERLLEPGTLGTLRQYSTVQEEDEDSPPEGDEMSATLLKVEAELDTSHGFPAQFDMTTSSGSREGSLAKAALEREKDQWLLVQDPLTSPYSGKHSPSPKVDAAVVHVNTPDVSPGNSQGNEWTVASSNNE